MSVKTRNPKILCKNSYMLIPEKYCNDCFFKGTPVCKNEKGKGKKK